MSAVYLYYNIKSAKEKADNILNKLLKTDMGYYEGTWTLGASDARSTSTLKTLLHEPTCVLLLTEYVPPKFLCWSLNP